MPSHRTRRGSSQPLEPTQEEDDDEHKQAGNEETRSSAKRLAQAGMKSTWTVATPSAGLAFPTGSWPFAGQGSGGGGAAFTPAPWGVADASSVDAEEAAVLRMPECWGSHREHHQLQE